MLGVFTRKNTGGELSHGAVEKGQPTRGRSPRCAKGASDFARCARFVERGPLPLTPRPSLLGAAANNLQTEVSDSHGPRRK